jgi:pimeloyl-ACP methyl ester carboxylesterase
LGKGVWKLKALRFILLAVAALVTCLLVFIHFFPAKVLMFALDAERKQAGLVRKEIHFGRDLHYVFLEGGQGEPLMLLHGFGANKDNFTRIARFLTPHYRVIIPDHTGFGESAKPKGASYTPTEQAKRLHELALALGISKVHLGGNSMGGQIALVYAQLYPDSVESLWLLAPGGLWKGPVADIWKELEKNPQALNPLVLEREEDVVALVSLVMEKPPFTPKAFLKLIARERMANASIEKQVFTDIQSHDITEDIRGLDIPSLIVWGNKDRVLHPGNADLLHELLPNSRRVLMEGIGHLPMMEAPEKSAEDYLKFRKTIQSAVPLG